MRKEANKEQRKRAGISNRREQFSEYEPQAGPGETKEHELRKTKGG